MKAFISGVDRDISFNSFYVTAPEDWEPPKFILRRLREDLSGLKFGPNQRWVSPSKDYATDGRRPWMVSQHAAKIHGIEIE
jgi:hypothetical protein